MFLLIRNCRGNFEGRRVQEEAFKTWLRNRKTESEQARYTRAYAVRTIEKHLEKLGSAHRDLESAWKADRFEHLRQRLRELREDVRAGGTAYRILMPRAEKPSGRLSSWQTWLGQYGQFLSDEPQGIRDADRIRRYVLDHYIEAARKRREDVVDVLVRDVNQALGLKQAWPNICQVLAGQKLREMADVVPPQQIGRDQSPATVFRFQLENTTSNNAGDKLFILYDMNDTAFKPIRTYNRKNRQSAFRIRPRNGSNLADDALEVGTTAEVARAMILEGLAARVQASTGGSINYLKYGKQKLVRYELDSEIAKDIGIPPYGRVQDVKDGGDIDEKNSGGKTQAPMSKPRNVIFYGPPGTGKTFATAQEAVRLCGVTVPKERDALMAVYNQLVDAGQIEFVTFHQSVAYEDFVEGLRPTQANKKGSAGFELEVKKGVFYQIAQRAEESDRRSSADFFLDKRQIFKMSIGEGFSSEDAHLFEEAIAGGYTLLGFEDIDWSDDRYTQRDAIIETLRSESAMGDDAPNALSGRVQMPFIFRNGPKIGDIIIVSKGNRLFRAIGEIVGDYQFKPRQGGTYAHRRAVRWLWIDRSGVPVNEIYRRSFSQKSIYLLDEADLDRPALERYIANSQSADRGKQKSFVLIIDEINRANISKVFGELITLLEPDKRLGQLNAIKVRLPYSGSMFGVPSNLHIIGTMNTADRSIALLDTALRRRFEFEELMPKPSELKRIDGIDLAKLLRSINEQIEYLFDREHQIGHAYLMDCQSRGDIDAAMRHKVIPLLAEYFFEDWSKVAAVLGDGTEGEGSREGCFIDRVRLVPPKGTRHDEEERARYRWKVREVFSYAEFAAE